MISLIKFVLFLVAAGMLWGFWGVVFCFCALELVAECFERK